MVATEVLSRLKDDYDAAEELLAVSGMQFSRHFDLGEVGTTSVKGNISQNFSHN